MGGERTRQPEFTSNGFDVNSGLPKNAVAIAETLREHGVFPRPAAEIAAAMDEQGLTPEEALEVFLRVLADTDDIGLAVSRLRSGVWDNAAQERALEKARRRRYGAVASEDGALGDRPQEIPFLQAVAEPDGSVRTPVGAFGTAEQAWQAALGELELEMTRATFNTHLRRSRLVAYDGGVFTVAVVGDYAKDWLEHRLASTVLRVLRRLAKQDVEVRFVPEAEWAAKSNIGVEVT